MYSYNYLKSSDTDYQVNHVADRVSWHDPHDINLVITLIFPFKIHVTSISQSLNSLCSVFFFFFHSSLISHTPPQLHIPLEPALAEPLDPDAKIDARSDEDDGQHQQEEEKADNQDDEDAAHYGGQDSNVASLVKGKGIVMVMVGF